MRVLGIALSLLFAASPIFADSVIANQTAPYSLGGTTTAIDPSSLITGSYTVTFAPDAQVATGSAVGVYAAPWDYVANGPWSGNYFTTGLGSVTISFTHPQAELAFLWGSVDDYNALRFDNGPQYQGSTFASFANITPVQGQGPGGSAYAEFFVPGGFTTVTFSSTQYAFEFAGVQASVPDGGMTLMLLGGALVGLATLRRKFRA